MDSYLILAEEVLREQRRPLGANQILRVAYQLGKAPPHLRGKTPQKTLGARLSEDILRGREKSKFYRTAPGRFFLREFENDSKIPIEFRKAIVARRRKRELPEKRALAIDWTDFQNNLTGSMVNDFEKVLSDIRDGCFHYAPSAPGTHGADVILWSFALVVKSGKVLTYRQGHYREDRDSFSEKRTIGFYAPVIDRDLGLFDQADHGIKHSALKVLAMDLDLLDPQSWGALSERSCISTFVFPINPISRDLLAVVAFSCPDWLDPTSKRLAINDLQWLDLHSPPNHWEDFDPWSQAILFDAREKVLQAAA